MAKDIAALSGADLTAFKDALAGYNYITPITSVTVSTPVEYVDIALPSGFSRFELKATNVAFSAQDELCTAVSTDGGSSFFCDGVNFDTYGLAGIDMASSYADIVTAGTLSFDSLSYLSSIPSAIIDTVTSINPGDDAHSFSMFTRCYSYRTDPLFGFSHILTFLNPSATSAPTYARIDMIRIFPYGNGDCPPTSGRTITSGEFILFGH